MRLSLYVAIMEMVIYFLEDGLVTILVLANITDGKDVAEKISM